jgi:hypothetical protein
MTQITIASAPVDAILQAVQKMLQNSGNLSAFEGKVTRGEEVNQDPERAPWIGIYPLRLQFVARTLGYGSGMRTQRVGIAIVVQHQSRTSGESCQDELHQFQAAVIDTLLSDPSLGGTVQVIDDFGVDYTVPAKQGAQSSFQSSIIQFTAVTQTGVSGG